MELTLPSTLGKGTGPNVPGHSDWVKDKQMTSPTNESFGKEILFLSELLNIGLVGYPHLHLERTHLEKVEGKRHREEKKNKEHRHRDKDRETLSLVTWLQPLNSEKHSSDFSITWANNFLFLPLKTVWVGLWPLVLKQFWWQQRWLKSSKITKQSFLATSSRWEGLTTMSTTEGCPEDQRGDRMFPGLHRCWKNSIRRHTSWKIPQMQRRVLNIHWPSQKYLFNNLGIDEWLGDMDSTMCHEGYKDESIMNSALDKLLSKFFVVVVV